MADNVTANSGSGGATFAGASLSFSGDTAVVPINSLGILSGSEGSWTFTLYTGGAGAVSAGTQRITLASDDPAVSVLGATGDAAATQGSTGSISAKLRTVTSQLNTIASTGIPITGTVTVGSHAVTNAGTFATQVDGAALTALQLIDDVVYADNGTFTDDASKLALVGGVYQSSPQTITDGKVAPILLDANGKVQIATHAVTQSGTWNVGTVTTVTTVSTVTNVATIGTSITPGTSAGHLGKAEDAAHSSGDTGVAVLGVRRDTPAVGSDSDGDYSTFNFDSSGRLWCNVNNTVTVASHAVTNAGTFAVQVDGSALTSLQLLDDVIFTDDGGFTPGTSKVAVVGFQADETATDSVDEGDAGAARMTLDRKLITSPQPHTAGGLSISRDIDLDNGTLTVVKNAAGQLYGWTITNTSTATVFVKFYDATSGTLGTGTPVLTIGIPGNSTDDTMAMQSFGGHGIAFGTGICVGAGTGVADADNTDPGANACVANIYFK